MSGIRMNRRTALQLLAAAGAASTVAPSRLFASDAVALREFSWAGPYETVPRRVTEEFIAANPGVSVDIIVGTNGGVYPQVEASVAVDRSQPHVHFGMFNQEAAERGVRAKLWAELSPELVPNLAKVPAAYREMNPFGATFAMDVCGLAYNKDLIEAPTSWDAIWDPKYKGKVAIIENFWAGNGLLMAARMNGGSEDNIEPGIAIYEEAARNGQFHSFVTSNAQMQQLLVQGEIVIAAHSRSVIRPWEKAGAPIGFVAPEEGMVELPLGYHLVDGGTDAEKAKAQQLINALIDPAAVSEMVQATLALPLIEGVATPEDVAADPTVSAESLANTVKLDFAKVAQNGAEWAQIWGRRVRAAL